MNSLMDSSYAGFENEVIKGIIMSTLSVTVKTKKKDHLHDHVL